MLRTSLIAVVLVVAAWFVVQALGSAPEQEQGQGQATERTESVRPNVVIVVIDDMAWEDLESTPVPVLDDLMARGRVYSNFYVCPVCSTSRAALQFGRYARRDGVFGTIHARDPDNHGVPLERVALPEVFGPAGYTTACFGKWHVSTENEVLLRTAAQQHGYEFWRAGHPSNLGEDGAATHNSWPRIDDGVRSSSQVYTGVAISEAFLEWWRTPTERPRFAVVNFMTPHEPFSRPPPELLPPGTDGSLDARARYECSLSALDTLIGRVVAAVDLSNTFVFVLPDNGTPAQARPTDGRHVAYKGSVCQGGVHVPLIVLGPGVVRGTCSHLAHVVDVARTVFELCDLTSAVGFEDSRSFAATLSGGTLAPREPVYMHHRVPNTDVQPVEHETWAVIDADGWKLAYDGARSALFNLRSDPYEKRPVDDSQRRARLAAVAERITGS